LSKSSTSGIGLGDAATEKKVTRARIDTINKKVAARANKRTAHNTVNNTTTGTIVPASTIHKSHSVLDFWGARYGAAVCRLSRKL
jgi:hypothetical protein